MQAWNYTQAMEAFEILKDFPMEVPLEKWKWPCPFKDEAPCLFMKHEFAWHSTSMLNSQFKLLFISILYNSTNNNF